jgi:UDP-galactopyranose mutase
MLVLVPINRTTLNALYACNLTSDAEAAFLAARAEPVEVVRTSADVVISAVGRELYETFFQEYTRKQWGMDPSELDKSVTSRVPTRANVDDRYFTGSFQAMPADGLTAMFERMLEHPNIELLLGFDYVGGRAPMRTIIWYSPDRTMNTLGSVTASSHIVRGISDVRRASSSSFSSSR